MVIEGKTSVNMTTSGYYPTNMDINPYDRERITSAADAMLKLSSSFQQDIPEPRPIPYPELSSSPVSVNDHSSDEMMRPRSSSMNSRDRADRAFVPENKKDEHYWTKRRKNNEAAKRSREKRKVLDMVTGEKVMYLMKENNELRDELVAIKEHFRLPVDQQFSASNVQDPKETPQDAILNSFRSIKPAVPAIPLAAMASFLQQQQQLVTQAAAVAAYQNTNSINTASDIKPFAVAPPNLVEHCMYNSVSTSNAMIPTPQILQPQYASSGAISETNQKFLSHGTAEYQKYQPIENGTNKCFDDDDSIARKRRKLSFDDADSDADDEEEGVLKIDESYHSQNSRCGSPEKRYQPEAKYENVSPAHSSTTSTSLNASINGDSQQHEVDLTTSHNNFYPQQQQQQQQQKGIPFKLRHKHMTFDQINPSNVGPNSGPRVDYNESKDNGYSNNRAENVPVVIHDMDSSSDDSSSYLGESDNSYQSNNQKQNSNTEYTDRRKRNNMAARKCRENKKLLLKMKEAQSDYLESENKKLKDDLKMLGSEVQSLKDLMMQKQNAHRHGEMFVPPPLEVLQRIILEKSTHKH